MKQEVAKILPCPFCMAMTPGNDVKIGKAALHDDGSVGKYMIECVYCDARSSKLSDGAEVVARWNRVASLRERCETLEARLAEAAAERRGIEKALAVGDKRFRAEILNGAEADDAYSAAWSDVRALAYPSREEKA